MTAYLLISRIHGGQLVNWISESSRELAFCTSFQLNLLSNSWLLVRASLHLKILMTGIAYILYSHN
jgi:hypothetical protein